MCLLWFVYQIFSRYLFLIKSILCSDVGPEEIHLLLLSDSADFSLLTKTKKRPSAKGPLGGGPAHSLFSPSSWQCWPESNPVTLGPLCCRRPSARPMWVDASYIIDKVCLGELQRVFAVRGLQCGRRQAHKLKAKVWHVVCAVCVTAQTQADSV